MGLLRPLFVAAGALQQGAVLLLVALLASFTAAAAKPADRPVASTASAAQHSSKDNTAEEGDDDADEVPDDPKRHLPTTEELRQTYQLRAEDGAILAAFKAPTLPDLSSYTPAALEAKIDRKPQGGVSVGSLLSEPGFKSLTTAIGQGLAEFAKRQSGGLRAIFVENGYVTIAEMSRDLPKDIIEQTAPGVYVVRLPILVRHGATLQIGSDVKQLRLSQDRGAVLANEGMLFITHSEVVGWNEAAGAPSRFRDKHEFRPFIVSWGGSKTFISESRIAHLGYASTKAFGLTLSQYSNTAIERQVWPRPTGWVLNSEIEDLWYGFYCWEASDLILRGNTLKNNIKYGFDPHDRSRNLIIAENEVYGTREKHGIIISRNVDNSWIIGNKSHDNGLSGIVLDRQCSNNVIANNLTYKNKSDGIVLSESSNNLVLGNLASGNQHHGIRLRNSSDIRIQDSSTIANGLAGIYGVARNLAGTDRNFKEDPYTQAMSMTLVNGQLTGNGSGPINLDEPTRATFYNVDLRTPQRPLGYRLGGALLAFQIEVLDIVLKQKQAAVLERRPPSPATATEP